MNKSNVSKTVLKTMNGRVESHVHQAGSGPPVVFLHGAGGPTWDPFLDDLAEHFTVYAPSLPGTEGDPDAVREIRGLWELMLHYYEVFDQLGLHSPAVIGHSFGGMLAAELAATNPERVSKLILISSIGLWRDEKPVEDWMRLTPDKLIPLCFYEPEGKVATEIFKMPEDKIERQDEEIRRSWSLACSAAFIWPIPEKGLTRRIHRVKAPGFIVWGKQDGLVPPIYADDFKKLLPNSEVLIVDKAAHVPQLERQDLVSPAVIKFLNQ